MGLLDLFGHKYPETSFHELNLDWCISAILQLQKAFKDFSAGNKLIFANPLQHDLTKTYAKNTIVIDSVSGTAYLSLDAVPVGVQLTNADYWLPVFDFASYVTRANQNFTDNYFSGTDRTPYPLAVNDWVVLDDVLYKVTVAMAADDLFIIGTNIIHFTVEQFLKDFITTVNNTLYQYSLTIQQYKNDIDASELAYQQQLAQDIANTTAQLQAELDLAISGATVDSEVINARVGLDGITESTLKESIDTNVKTYFNINDMFKTGSLFNPVDADILFGQVIASDGSITPLANYNTTGYMPIIKGRSYTAKQVFGTGGGYYDTDKNFIAQVSFTTATNYTFVAPYTGYIRLTFYYTNLYDFYFNEGSSEQNVQPVYPMKYADGFNISVDNVVGDYGSAIEFYEGNLIDVDTLTNDKIINNDGTIGTLNGYSYTDYIPVKKGVPYFLSTVLGTGGGLYDESYNFVTNISPYGSNVVYTPYINGYIRLNVNTGQAYNKTATVNKGNTKRIYPYHGKVTNPNLIIDQSNINKWSGKSVLFIGDSISHDSTWISMLKSMCDFNVVFDRTVGGSLMSRMSGHTLSFCERVAASGNNDPTANTAGMPGAGMNIDLVVVWGGVNDWAYENTFGSILDGLTIDTYCGALKYLMKNLKNMYPAAKIVFVNNYRVCAPSGGSTSWSEVTYATPDNDNTAMNIVTKNGHTFDDYRKALYDMASYMGVSVIDMLNAGFSFTNTVDRNLYSYERDYSGIMLHDGIHPNTAGDALIAKHMYVELQKI